MSDRSSFEPLSRQLYSILRAGILRGEVATGETLTERGLAEHHATSRTPIRECLHFLESEGLVEFLPRVGYVVMGLSPAEIVHLYQARGFLMSYVVGEAAKGHISGEVLDKLRAVVREGRECVERQHDVDEYLRLTDRFDGLLVSACGSRILTRMMGVLEEYCAPLRRKTASTAERRSELWGDHEAILRSIESRDVEAACNRAMEHVGKAEEFLKGRAG